MTTVALHGSPRWLVPARRQLALLLQSGRVRTLLLVSLGTLILTRMTGAGRALIPPGQSHEVNGLLAPDLLRATPWLFLVGIGWALLVWRGEGRDRRGHHWSMPVSRAAHDGWRVFAGAAWLMVAVGLFAAAGAALALIDDTPALFRHDLRMWLNLFTLPLILYLLVSVLTVATARPVGWLLGIVVAVGVAAIAAEQYQMLAVQETLGSLVAGRYGFAGATWGGIMASHTELVQAALAREGQPDFAMAVGSNAPGTWPWVAATALWLSIAVFGLVLAARRRP